MKPLKMHVLDCERVPTLIDYYLSYVDADTPLDSLSICYSIGKDLHKAIEDDTELDDNPYTNLLLELVDEIQVVLSNMTVTAYRLKAIVVFVNGGIALITEV